MAKTIFEKMGGTYTQVGDYLLPDLKLPEEEQQPIGVWGQRHRRYLKEHHRATYATLLTGGKLNGYLADIDRQAEAPFYIIKDCYVANGDIRVDLDRDGNATIEQQKAFRLEEYGIVYVAGNGILDQTKNTVVMKLSFLVEQNGQWGLLSGTSFEEKFTIPAK